MNQLNLGIARTDEVVEGEALPLPLCRELIDFLRFHNRGSVLCFRTSQ